MAPYDNSRRIVKSECGPGTCETIYTDDRGARWFSSPYISMPSGPTSGTTSETWGILRNGYIDPVTR